MPLSYPPTSRAFDNKELFAKGDNVVVTHQKLIYFINKSGFSKIKFQNSNFLLNEKGCFLNQQDMNNISIKDWAIKYWITRPLARAINDYINENESFFRFGWGSSSPFYHIKHRGENVDFRNRLQAILAHFNQVLNNSNFDNDENIKKTKNALFDANLSKIIKAGTNNNHSFLNLYRLHLLALWPYDYSQPNTFYFMEVSKSRLYLKPKPISQFNNFQNCFNDFNASLDPLSNELIISFNQDFNFWFGRSFVNQCQRALHEWARQFENQDREEFFEQVKKGVLLKAKANDKDSKWKRFFNDPDQPAYFFTQYKMLSYFKWFKKIVENPKTNQILDDVYNLKAPCTYTNFSKMEKNIQIKQERLGNAYNNLISYFIGYYQELQICFHNGKYKTDLFSKYDANKKLLQDPSW